MYFVLTGINARDAEEMAFAFFSIESHIWLACVS